MKFVYIEKCIENISECIILYTDRGEQMKIVQIGEPKKTLHILEGIPLGSGAEFSCFFLFLLDAIFAGW